MTTHPSTKSMHRVILNKTDNSFCVLEVKRKGTFFIYEIENTGEATLVANTEVPYVLDKEERDEVYFLDYLSGAVLDKIDVLTENLNLENITLRLLQFKNTVNQVDYDIDCFEMDHFNLLEDYKKWVSQMKEFTQDNEYAQKIVFLDEFFDQAFYNRNKDLSEEEKEQIIQILNQELSWINSHQIQ